MEIKFFTHKTENKKKTFSIQCPICKKKAVKPHIPFCSKKCGDLDLIDWLLDEKKEKNDA